MLREIAWRLREIGNDGRICDLIDSQVTVIEKSTDQFSSEDARLALRAAFAALQGRLVEFSDDDPTLEMETEAAAPSPAAPALDLVAEIAEAFFAREAANKAPPANNSPPAEKAPPVVEAPPAAEAPRVAPAMRTELAPSETSPPSEVAAAEQAAVPETAFQSAGIQDAAADATDTNAEDANAQDEAVLDMIAMEMGAPDPIGDDEIEIAAAIAEQAHPAEPAPVVAAIVAKAPEPVPRRRSSQ